MTESPTDLLTPVVAEARAAWGSLPPARYRLIVAGLGEIEHPRLDVTDLSAMLDGFQREVKRQYDRLPITAGRLAVAEAGRAGRHLWAIVGDLALVGPDGTITVTLMREEIR